ncbi:MAG: efflux RND transporter periplasmic adaptor subunit [Acidobacteria bacterium]|nr:efflux RND transporter periplasmic adaptor subunit [Acidobacteriota bacterium]
MRSLRRDTGILLFAGVSLVLSGCGEKEAAKKAEGASGPAVPVVVGTVEQKTVPVYSELTARTDANDSVEIRARVKAYLQAQHFQEGSMVKKGQPLFTLDKREYEAQMMQAKAQLAKSEADLVQAKERTVVDVAAANLEVSNAQLNKTDQDVNRLKPLAEAQAVPQQDYDNALAAQRAARADVEAKKASLSTSKVNQTAQIQQAQAAVEAAKAAVMQAGLNIEYCNLVSPIDGIVGTRQVAPGNLVGQGEATLLTTVSNVNPMRVFVAISEREYLQFMKLRLEGKRAQGAGDLELVLADGSTFPHKGRMIIADRAVDVKTGTLSIVAEFPNPNALLRPGQFGRVRFAATVAENALLVPQKAVTEMQSAKIVYVVSPENKVQLRSVTLGERVGENFIVTEGLKAGEKIVVEGLQKVRPGSTVTPTAAPATSEKAEAKKGE